MEYIRDVLPTILSSAIGFILWRIQRELERREKIHTEETAALKTWRKDVTDNAIAISRYHLMRIYQSAMSAGYITPDQLTVFESLYESYHDLGGNGVVTAYREHLLELPSRSQENSTIVGGWIK